MEPPNTSGRGAGLPTELTGPHDGADAHMARADGRADLLRWNLMGRCGPARLKLRPRKDRLAAEMFSSQKRSATLPANQLPALSGAGSLRSCGPDSPSPISLSLQSTPLHLAAGYNRVRIVQLLLQHGADVHAKDKGWAELSPVATAASM